MSNYTYTALAALVWGIAGSMVGLYISQKAGMLPTQVLEFRDPAFTEARFETATKWHIMCVDERNNVLINEETSLARLTAGGIRVLLDGTSVILHGVACVAQGGQLFEGEE